MTTIQLHIPEYLAVKMDKLTSNAEAFIIDLIHSKVSELDKETSLADEYHLASLENKDLADDFSTVDLENWNDKY